MFRPGKGQSAARRLAALPAGSHVRLRHGGIWVKYVTRWMVAGFVDRPLTSKALARLNADTMPTVMVPAATARYRDAW